MALVKPEVISPEDKTQFSWSFYIEKLFLLYFGVTQETQKDSHDVKLLNIQLIILNEKKRASWYDKWWWDIGFYWSSHTYFEWLVTSSLSNAKGNIFHHSRSDYYDFFPSTSNIFRRRFGITLPQNQIHAKWFLFIIIKLQLHYWKC